MSQPSTTRRGSCGLTAGRRIVPPPPGPMTRQASMRALRVGPRSAPAASAWNAVNATAAVEIPSLPCRGPRACRRSRAGRSPSLNAPRPRFDDLEVRALHAVQRSRAPPAGGRGRSTSPVAAVVGHEHAVASSGPSGSPARAAGSRRRRSPSAAGSARPCAGARDRVLLARPVRRGQHVGAARPAHREAHRVVDHAPRALVVAHDGGEDRAGRPRRDEVQRSGRSAPVRRSKVAPFERLPARRRCAAPARTRGACRSRDRPR